MVQWDDVKAIVARLIEASAAAGQPLGEPIVLVGGSAMAAHGVRDESLDVDLYAPSASDEVVHALEVELAARFGAPVRIDVTAGENLWGNILLRDIADSPVVAEIDVVGTRHTLRALSLEDLFLLKLNSSRRKDRDDVALLARHLSVERLIPRFNQVVRWHGDRHAVLGYADLFVASLAQHFGAAPMTVIATLAVPQHVRAELEATHAPGG
ncbi:MAG: nucleotidyl transferase AbiEii/AbiGii toxin family protein [Deltaproteobacteria bacterium]|nr:nucleotidyl transferase AbiEii/AbiGii toxin family protein [Deltaproteobacteria bacterium]